MGTHDTYDMTTGIAKKFGGAYGLGIIYAKTSSALPKATDLHWVAQPSAAPAASRGRSGDDQLLAGLTMKMYLLSLGAGLLVGVSIACSTSAPRLRR